MTFLAVSANQLHKVHRGAIPRIVIVLFIMFLVMEELAQPTMAGSIWSRLKKNKTNLNNTEEEGKPPKRKQLKNNELEVMKQAVEVNQCYQIYNASASTGLTPRKINQIKYKLEDALKILRKQHQNEKLDKQIADTIPVTVKNLEKLLELTENPDNLTKPYEPIQPEKLQIDYEVMFKQNWFRHLNAEKLLNFMAFMLTVAVITPLFQRALWSQENPKFNVKPMFTQKAHSSLKPPPINDHQPTMFHSDFVTVSTQMPSNPIMSIILLIVVAVTISAIVYVITCLVTRKRSDSKKMSKSSRVAKSSSVKSSASSISSRSSVVNSSPKEKKSGNRSSPKSMK